MYVLGISRYYVPYFPSITKSLRLWGLPDTILNEYKEKGITSMFQWQVKFKAQNALKIML